jgi:hypothetical protein
MDRIASPLHLKHSTVQVTTWTLSSHSHCTRRWYNPGARSSCQLEEAAGCTCSGRPGCEAGQPPIPVTVPIHISAPNPVPNPVRVSIYVAIPVSNTKLNPYPVPNP